MEIKTQNTLIFCVTLLIMFFVNLYYKEIRPERIEIKCGKQAVAQIKALSDDLNPVELLELKNYAMDECRSVGGYSINANK